MQDTKFLILALRLEDITNADLLTLITNINDAVVRYTRAGTIADQQALIEKINRLIDSFFKRYITNLVSVNQSIGKLQADNAMQVVIPMLQKAGLYKLAIELYNDVKSFEASVERRLLFNGWAGKPLNYTLKTVRVGTQKTVQNIIHNAVKEGKGAKEISKMIAQYIAPIDSKAKVRPLDQYRKRFGRPKNFTPKNMPVGSLQYNALRIARTETAHMYRQATLEFYDDKPYIKGFTYVLSNRHPKKDICDVYSKKIYKRAEDVPLTHPNCLCRIGFLMYSREELKRLKDGGILTTRAVKAGKALVNI